MQVLQPEKREPDDQEGNEVTDAREGTERGCWLQDDSGLRREGVDIARLHHYSRSRAI